MLTTAPFPLFAGEEGSEIGEPFLAASDEVSRGQRIGPVLKSFGVGTTDKGIAALLEPNAGLAHAVGQPVMLVEANPG